MSDVSLVNAVDLQVTNIVDSLSLSISDISTTKNTTHTERYRSRVKMLTFFLSNISSSPYGTCVLWAEHTGCWTMLFFNTRYRVYSRHIKLSYHSMGSSLITIQSSLYCLHSYSAFTICFLSHRNALYVEDISEGCVTPNFVYRIL